MLKKFTIPILLSALLTMLCSGCGSANQSDPTVQPTTEETKLLLQYLEENGNLLNGPEVPSLIDASDLFPMLTAVNVHIIDLRPWEEYAEGHIPQSVQVSPANILHHFERVIEPNAFDFIVLACPNAQLATFVNYILRVLGYNNVHSLRYGLSGWNSDIAQNYWLSDMSNRYADRLETTTHSKPPQGSLPAIATGHSDGYSILRARAETVLKTVEDMHSVSMNLDAIEERAEEIFLINYWPEALYMEGHLPGAIQYTPKASLHSNAQLTTLPYDQPILLYCFTGHHTGYVAGYLRILGYDAYHLPYGANSFIYSTMLTTQGATRSFTPDTPANYPLQTATGSNALIPQSPDTPETQPIPGGC